MFGAWMTRKNVVTTLVKSINFTSWSVTEEQSQGGLSKQFHIFAQKSDFKMESM